MDLYGSLGVIVDESLAAAQDDDSEDDDRPRPYETITKVVETSDVAGLLGALTRVSP